MSLHGDPVEERLVKLAELLSEVNSLPWSGKRFTVSSTTPSPGTKRGGYSSFLRLLRYRRQMTINTKIRATPPAALGTTSITMSLNGEPVHRESRYVFLVKFPFII